MCADTLPTTGRVVNSHCKQDGRNNDRYVDPATGEAVPVNSQRGDPTTLLDLRATKFIELGGDRRIGVFAELFNVFSTNNFGASCNGNARSAVFHAANGIPPEHRVPAPAAAGRAVHVLE